MTAPRYELEVWKTQDGRRSWHWSLRVHEGLETRVERRGESRDYVDACRRASIAREELGLKTVELRRTEVGHIAVLIPVDQTALAGRESP